ncbi:MAG: hypothetical protein QXG98_05915, partial [Candidatus Micrarchaeia archaeon]
WQKVANAAAVGASEMSGAREEGKVWEGVGKLEVGGVAEQDESARINAQNIEGRLAALRRVPIERAGKKIEVRKIVRMRKGEFLETGILRRKVAELARLLALWRARR